MNFEIVGGAVICSDPELPGLIGQCRLREAARIAGVTDVVAQNELLEELGAFDDDVDDLGDSDALEDYFSDTTIGAFAEDELDLDLEALDHEAGAVLANRRARRAQAAEMRRARRRRRREAVLAEVGFLKKFRRKIKKATKKVASKAKRAAKATVRVAKKVAKNRLVKAAWNSMKKLPPPASLYVEGAEAAVAIGKQFAKGSKRAKTAKRLIDGAARGKISPPKLKALSRKFKLNPKAVSAASLLAAGLRNKNPLAVAAAKSGQRVHALSAKGDAAALASLATETELRRKHPGARSYTAQAPSGRSYRAVVVPV